MRIGLILECRPGGPDADVYKYIVEKLCKGFQVNKPETLIDKKSLISEAAQVAEILNQDNCEYVFIIWDKMPRWGQGGNCSTDKEALIKSLNELNIDISKVILCCIDEMMESWLFADSRGFMNWIRSKTNHPLSEIGDNSTRALQTAPKERVKRYLRDNYNKWKYNDYTDNLPIVKQLPDFNRAADYNDSFKFFKESIEQICPK